MQLWAILTLLFVESENTNKMIKFFVFSTDILLERWILGVAMVI
jgi:hypothetical protein